MTNMFDLSLLPALGIHTITHLPSEQPCAEEFGPYFEFGLC